jgi:hypothetical protein
MICYPVQSSSANTNDAGITPKMVYTSNAKQGIPTMLAASVSPEL